jgi:hypothetical protein
MDKCVICSKETSTVFNINFKAVSICEHCASAITKQNVIALCDAAIQGESK